MPLWLVRRGDVMRKSKLCALVFLQWHRTPRAPLAVAQTVPARSATRANKIYARTEGSRDAAAGSGPAAGGGGAGGRRGIRAEPGACQPATRRPSRRMGGRFQQGRRTSKFVFDDEKHPCESPDEAGARRMRRRRATAPFRRAPPARARVRSNSIPSSGSRYTCSSGSTPGRAGVAK